MRKLLILASVAVLWPVWVLATPTQPMPGVTMSRQSYVPPPFPTHPWVMVNPQQKTTFDVLQENLKIITQFKELLKVKAAKLKHANGNENGTIGAVGQGTIGGVGGIGTVGSNGNGSTSIADLFDEITPEEAAAALKDDYERSHPKTLSDLLKPKKNPSLMEALETRVFGQTRHDEFTGFHLANTTPASPLPGTKAVKTTAEKPASAPAPAPVAPPPSGSSQSPIGRVGGLGKVGPN